MPKIEIEATWHDVDVLTDATEFVRVVLAKDFVRESHRDAAAAGADALRSLAERIIGKLPPREGQTNG